MSEEQEQYEVEGGQGEDLEVLYEELDKLQNDPATFESIEALDELAALTDLIEEAGDAEVADETRVLVAAARARLEADDDEDEEVAAEAEASEAGVLTLNGVGYELTDTPPKGVVENGAVVGDEPFEATHEATHEADDAVAEAYVLMLVGETHRSNQVLDRIVQEHPTQDFAMPDDDALDAARLRLGPKYRKAIEPTPPNPKGASVVEDPERPEETDADRAVLATKASEEAKVVEGETPRERRQRIEAARIAEVRRQQSAKRG